MRLGAFLVETTTIRCISSGDDDLDCILGGQVSDELHVVAMMESPQLTPAARRTCWASYWLPLTMLIARQSCHPAKAGHENCAEEAVARALSTSC